MAHSKGFSLIETLVAIILASISTLALLQVIATSSKTSARALGSFEESLMMGLMIGLFDDDSLHSTLHVDEAILSRYTIDNSEIIHSLKPPSFTLESTQKEVMDTLTTTSLSGVLIQPPKLLLQKTVIRHEKEKKIFFTITSETL